MSTPWALHPARAAGGPPPDPAAIAAAAAAIRDGAVVCFPTETTYGLAVDAAQPAALERLIALKGRDPQAPFSLIVADAAQARALAAVWPPRADELTARHWPGPLTLVVPARPGLPAAIVGPGGGVGVRVSSHPWALALVRAVGAPITATSANPSGQPPALTAAAARAAFADGVAVYLDAGAAQPSASTLIEVRADGTLRLLRAGPIELPDLPPT